MRSLSGIISLSYLYCYCLSPHKVFQFSILQRFDKEVLLIVLCASVADDDDNKCIIIIIIIIIAGQFLWLLRCQLYLQDFSLWSILEKTSFIRGNIIRFDRILHYYHFRTSYRYQKQNDDSSTWSVFTFPIFAPEMSM